MSKHWIQYSRKQRCNDNTLQYPVVFTNKSQCSSISHTIPHVKPCESILPCVQTTQRALYLIAQLLTTSPVRAWALTTGTRTKTSAKRCATYWQVWRLLTNITSDLAKSSIPPPKANNTNNTQQNLKTNQKHMKKKKPNNSSPKVIHYDLKRWFPHHWRSLNYNHWIRFRVPLWSHPGEPPW